MKNSSQQTTKLGRGASIALLWAAFLLLGQPLAADKSTPLLSVKVNGNKLVVIARGVGEMTFHGTFKNRSGQVMVFDDGRLVKATDAKGTFFVADSFRIDSGRLVFRSGKAEWKIEEGEYMKQQGGSDPRPQPEPQPPNPQGFKVKDGKIVEVTYEE